jgi:hypothetical protein
MGSARAARHFACALVSGLPLVVKPVGGQQPTTGIEPARVSAPTEATLTALYRTMMDANFRADTATLARVWAPNYVHRLTTSDDTMQWSRAERLSGVVGTPANEAYWVESVTVERCSIQVFPEFAAGLCFDHVRVRSRTKQESLRSAVMVLFVPGARGQWQIASTHATEVPAI